VHLVLAILLLETQVLHEGDPFGIACRDRADQLGGILPAGNLQQSVKKRAADAVAPVFGKNPHLHHETAGLGVAQQLPGFGVADDTAVLFGEDPV
jgi:hypothetical protein